MISSPEIEFQAIALVLKFSYEIRNPICLRIVKVVECKYCSII